MRENTKNIIYMALDLLESMNKSANQNNQFIIINKNEMNQVKNDLFELIIDSGKISESVEEKKKKLIGTLPYVLMDKTKFPTNMSIAKLAENSLNFKISSPDKRGREEMIGLIIGKIANDQDNKFTWFMEIWKEFIDSEKLSENVKINKDFVDIWLDFFKKSQRNK
jgi:hypothetical protein